MCTELNLYCSSDRLSLKWTSQGREEGGPVTRVKQIPSAHTQMFWYCEGKRLRWNRVGHNIQTDLQIIGHHCKDSIKPVHDRIQWQAVTKTFHASQAFSWIPVSPLSSGGLCWLELRIFVFIIWQSAACTCYNLSAPAWSLNIYRHTPAYAIKT